METGDERCHLGKSSAGWRPPLRWKRRRPHDRSACRPTKGIAGANRNGRPAPFASDCGRRCALSGHRDSVVSHRDTAMTHSDLLVVDDDNATRTGLRHLLADAGFTVDVAQDGAEALDKIAHRDFGVVLLDVRLPKIGGLDILARCGHSPHPPKVIVMTGVDTTDVVLDALRRQAYDFLPKPIEPARLIDVVKRALSTGAAVTPIEVVSARPAWLE